MSSGWREIQDPRIAWDRETRRSGFSSGSQERNWRCPLAVDRLLEGDDELAGQRSKNKDHIWMKTDLTTLGIAMRSPLGFSSGSRGKKIDDVRRRSADFFMKAIDVSRKKK